MQRTIQVTAALIVILRQYLRDKTTILDVVFSESKRLGGVYVKFLQQLASSEQAVSRLSSLVGNFDVYDNVARETIDIKAMLRAELGSRANEFEVLNNNEPIATGSFAQVYLAEHAELGKVIIKALRPSVTKNLAADLRLLRVMSYLLQLGLSSDLINAPRLASEFIKATKQETNYKEEARLAGYLKRYFEQREAPVYIPATHEDYTTRTILVQEYIEGIKFSEVILRAKTTGDAESYVAERLGSQLYTQLENFGAELLSSLFFADYIMADPHPGNIILLPDNRVAMIDFGLVAPAPARRSIFYGMVLQYRHLYEKKTDLSTLALAMMAFYDYELYDALKTHAQSLGSTMTNLRDTIARFAIPEELYTSHNFTQYRLTSLVMLDINTNNQFGIRVSAENIVLQKAMRSYLTSVRLACTNLDDYNAVVYQSVARAEEEARLRGIKETTPASRLTPDEAREITADWLSQIAERNELFFNNLVKEFQT